jgi:hypothetical protein
MGICSAVHTGRIAMRPEALPRHHLSPVLRCPLGGPMWFNGQTQDLHGSHGCASALLRSAQPLATRHQRKHQPAAAATLCSRYGPVRPIASTTRSSCLASEPTPSKTLGFETPAGKLRASYPTPPETCLRNLFKSTNLSRRVSGTTDASKMQSTSKNHPRVLLPELRPREAGGQVPCGRRRFLNWGEVPPRERLSILE